MLLKLCLFFWGLSPALGCSAGAIATQCGRAAVDPWGIPRDRDLWGRHVSPQREQWHRGDLGLSQCAEGIGDTRHGQLGVPRGWEMAAGSLGCSSGFSALPCCHLGRNGGKPTKAERTPKWQPVPLGGPTGSVTHLSNRCHQPPMGVYTDSHRLGCEPGC